MQKKPEIKFKIQSQVPSDTQHTISRMWGYLLYSHRKKRWSFVSSTIFLSSFVYRTRSG